MNFLGDNFSSQEKIQENLDRARHQKRQEFAVLVQNRLVDPDAKPPHVVPNLHVIGGRPPSSRALDRNRWFITLEEIDEECKEEIRNRDQGKVPKLELGVTDAFEKRLIRRQEEIDKGEHLTLERRERIKQTYVRQEAATASALREWGLQPRSAPKGGGKCDRDWYNSPEWEDYYRERMGTLLKQKGYCGHRRQ